MRAIDNLEQLGWSVEDSFDTIEFTKDHLEIRYYKLSKTVETSIHNYEYGGFDFYELKDIMDYIYAINNVNDIFDGFGGW